MEGFALQSLDDKTSVVIFAFLILIAFGALCLFAYISYRLQNQKPSPCPYTGKMLRPGEYVPLSSAIKIMRFLYYDIHNFDNRVFPLKRSMICRDTGRIFQDCVTWWGSSHVDWNFIQKRYPGTYVSWGSLSSDLQREFKERHHSLEGFQTEFSSANVNPKDVEERFVYRKPGPLYCDIESKVLVGWKCVPNTPYEVLIVQKPRTLK
jgi:hypothetical protein